ncbi:MAG: hypothetical protein M3R48_10210 [Candidatus Dormibacteraeota bacterium]|nr:hypothetical protein [Candidatus Dormibacteraeota bacterium]
MVHSFSLSPDDISVDAVGRLWVTARQQNLLVGMDGGGGALRTETISGGPEGVASDGATLYVAQQDRNAVVAVTPAIRTYITFPNRTPNAGIDGLYVDSVNHRLLVPDSPVGELFAVSLAGLPNPQLLGSGLGRPVAAAADAAGNVFVASESSPGLTMILPSGATRTVGHFANIDEVVAYAGLLYVTELDRHDVLAVDPSTGDSVPVATDLPSPQGLAVTASGILEIVDATLNTVYSMPACGVAP